MLFLAGFLEHLQKGFLSNFLYVLSSMYHQIVRQRGKNFDIQRNTRVGSGGQFTSNRLSCHHMHLYFLLHLHSHLRLYSHLHLHLRSWARGTVAPNHRSTSRVQTCRMSLIWQMYLCEKLADSGKSMGGTRLLCFGQGLWKHLFHFIRYFVLHRFDSISEIFQSILTN